MSVRELQSFAILKVHEYFGVCGIYTLANILFTQDTLKSKKKIQNTFIDKHILNFLFKIFTVLVKIPTQTPKPVAYGSFLLIRKKSSFFSIKNYY